MLFGTSAYVLGPLIAFAVVGILVAILAWTFNSDPRRAQEKVLAAQSGSDYGLLRVVGTAHDILEARVLIERLAAADIRATFAPTPDGHINVLVFDNQLIAAKKVMGGTTL